MKVRPGIDNMTISNYYNAVLHMGENIVQMRGF